MLAEIYLRNNQNHERALNLMLDVVATDADAKDYDILSWAYFVNGYLNESLEALNRAMKIEPNSPVYQQRYQKLKQRIDSLRAQ